jgi:hypothetical protein
LLRSEAGKVSVTIAPSKGSIQVSCCNLNGRFVVAAHVCLHTCYVECRTIGAYASKERPRVSSLKQPLNMSAYEEIIRKAALSDSAVAYIGDYLPDIPLMRCADLAGTGDAVPEVKAAHTTLGKRSLATVQSAKPLNSF